MLEGKFASRTQPVSGTNIRTDIHLKPLHMTKNITINNGGRYDDQPAKNMWAENSADIPRGASAERRDKKCPLLLSDKDRVSVCCNKV